MSEVEAETATLDIGGGGPAESPAGAGLVTLYAPDLAVVPSTIALPDLQLLIGRNPPHGSLSLPLSSISRVHARLARKGAEIVIDDLDSRNGTFVNGKKVRNAFLEDGDEIRLGEVLFKFVSSGVDEYRSVQRGVPKPPLDRLRGGLAMDRVRREILRTAKAPISVLILGETGTGKELVARALHDASQRVGRFATVNCAAIPATLLESELFGYKRGAFTGADRDRPGLVKSAEGGTLFLDEIGDMPLEAQAKVLRMIETRTITPLGTHAPEPVDVRIVGATHRPLPRFVREERFRADLFARISGHIIRISPLRDRKEDISDLVHYFLASAGGLHLQVTPAFMLGLFDYDWPLNVRELESAMKRAVALADRTLDATHLPPGITERGEAEWGGEPPGQGTTPGKTPSVEELRASLERHEGNVAAVGREFGKDRVQIHRWLKRYGITADDFRA